MSNITPSQTGTAPEPVTTQPPPEERFWQRYSPHKEFPLSTATSVVLHGLLLALVAVIVTQLWVDTNRSTPLDMDVLEVGDGKPGGEGTEPGKGVLPLAHREDATAEHHHPAHPAAAVKDASLPAPTPREPTIKVPQDADDRVVEVDPKQAVERFRELRRNANPDGTDHPSPGSGTPGPGGSGRGSKLDEHVRRALRWTMSFSTADGNDYRQQLIALGAILAVPEPSGDNKHTYRVYRDLEHTPVKGHVEDLNKLDRIFWVDEKQESVERLSRSLGIRPPRLIAAFFPKELEQKLLKMERAKSGGRPEDEIKETIFRVEERGGTYEPVVEEVRLKEKP